MSHRYIALCIGSLILALPTMTQQLIPSAAIRPQDPDCPHLAQFLAHATEALNQTGSGTDSAGGVAHLQSMLLKLNALSLSHDDAKCSPTGAAVYSQLSAFTHRSSTDSAINVGIRHYFPRLADAASAESPVAAFLVSNDGEVKDTATIPELPSPVTMAFARELFPIGPGAAASILVTELPIGGHSVRVLWIRLSP